jgi:long-chain-acyl-CoA dehydrogenase
MRLHYDEEHELFRESVRSFVQREVVPHHDDWEAAGLVDKSLFHKAGRAGFLAMAAPERWGGGGTRDFRFNAIITEEACWAGVYPSVMGIALHNDMCLPYFLEVADDEQKERWLPGITSGALVTAIAMTEPGTGSDLAGVTTRATRDGDHYVISGAKTFITNGINADLVMVVCTTNPSERHRGISLVVVETGTPGFERGRKLAKAGLHAQDTAELFFDQVRVPVSNRLGAEGEGFRYLMGNLPQERLSIAVSALALAEAAFDWTLHYVRDRRAFGQAVGSFQASRFKMAEMRTGLDVAQAFLAQQVLALNDGELTAAGAAEAKWWCTELSGKVIDRCVQLHGGYGYMDDYPVSRAWRDGRAMRIYGGTTEVMKEVVGRSLGL